MNNKVAVYITTTQGPVGIMRLTEEPGLRLSIASIGLETRKSSISDAYHDFVCRDTGVIARHTRSELYRLHLARDIEQGDSWKLGVYLAHQLFHQQRLTGSSIKDEAPEAQLLILATGAINIDGDILPVTDIPRKLEAARPLLEMAHQNGTKVLFFLPTQNLTPNIEVLLSDLKNSHPNMDFAGVSRVTFDTLPPGIPQAEENDQSTEPNAFPEPAATVAAKSSKIAWPKNLVSLSDVPSRKKYAGLFLVATVVPLAVLSVLIKATAPPDPQDPQTRLRLLTAADNQCFGKLHEEAWIILSWEEDNNIHGLSRICQVEIHTENTTKTDQTIEVFSHDQLLKVGFMPAISSRSIRVPTYRLKNPHLTLKLHAAGNLKSQAAVSLHEPDF